MLRLSSQFTDYVHAMYPENSKSILEDVRYTFNRLRDRISPFNDPEDRRNFLNVLKAFHTTDMSDLKVLDVFRRSGNPITLDEAYSILQEIGLTGDSAEALANFPGPNRPNASRQVNVDIQEKENISRWERNEERILDTIQRKRDEFEELVTAGLVERIPTLQERKDRLEQRKYAWAQFV